MKFYEEAGMPRSTATARKKPVRNGLAEPDPLPIVSINLGLTAKNIAAIGSVIASLLAAGAFGSWLFIPAKQSDMIIVQTGLKDVTGAVEKLTKAVDTLNSTYADLAARQRTILSAINRKAPKGRSPQ